MPSILRQLPSSETVKCTKASIAESTKLVIPTVDNLGYIACHIFLLSLLGQGADKGLCYTFWAMAKKSQDVSLNRIMSPQWKLQHSLPDGKYSSGSLACSLMWGGGAHGQSVRCSQCGTVTNRTRNYFWAYGGLWCHLPGKISSNLNKN